MTRRALLLAFLFVSSPLIHADQAQDLSGTWSGSFITLMNGQEKAEEAHLVLVQKGNVLTGTAGPSLDRQSTIIDGKVDGTKVSFGMVAGGPLVKFTLTVVNGRLKGDASAEMDSGSMTAKVDVGRIKSSSSPH